MTEIWSKHKYFLYNQTRIGILLFLELKLSEDMINVIHYDDDSLPYVLGQQSM